MTAELNRAGDPLRASGGRDVAVLIPTVHGRRFLPDCLAALGRQGGRRFRVVVAHNGGRGDDAVEWLRAAHPDVEILDLGINRGFGAAVNAGLAATREPFVAVLNDDARPEPGWLEALVGRLEAEPRLSFACGKVLMDRDPRQLDSAGDGLSPWLLPYPIGRFERDVGQFDEPRRVLLPPGSAALFRRSLFQDAGPFEASFFAYMEDVDLGVRACLLGHRGVYVPEAVVRHIGSGSTGGMINAVTVRLSTRNLVRVQVRSLPAAVLLERLHRVAAGHLYWFLKMAVKERHPAAWLRGCAGGLACLPADLRARRRLLRRRRIDNRALKRLLDASAREVQDSIRRKRQGRSAG